MDLRDLERGLLRSLLWWELLLSELQHGGAICEVLRGHGHVLGTPYLDPQIKSVGVSLRLKKELREALELSDPSRVSSGGGDGVIGARHGINWLCGRAPPTGLQKVVQNYLTDSGSRVGQQIKRKGKARSSDGIVGTGDKQ